MEMRGLIEVHERLRVAEDEFVVLVSQQEASCCGEYCGQVRVFSGARQYSAWDKTSGKWWTSSGNLSTRFWNSVDGTAVGCVICRFAAAMCPW